MSSPKSTPVPHSWSIDSWPATVFPGTPSRAHHLLRKHRAELIQAGILSRVGRQLIVLGDRYAKWLQLHTADAPSYLIPPNTPEARAARAARRETEAAA